MIEITKTNDITGLVLFTADWCQPCQKLKPLIKDDVDFMITLNDGHTYDVHSIPTVRVYKDGQVKDELIGPTAAAVRELKDTYFLV